MKGAHIARAGAMPSDDGNIPGRPGLPYRYACDASSMNRMHGKG